MRRCVQVARVSRAAVCVAGRKRVLSRGGPRGRPALALAAAGGAILLASALRPWAEPSRVPWPSYTDGVPNWISHPSDVHFRIVAAALGLAALALVALAGSGLRHPVAWAVLALLGVGGLVVGAAGFDTVDHYRGFGSIVANDITLDGFRHGLLNYLELVGAALLCLAPLAALRSLRSAQ